MRFTSLYLGACLLLFYSCSSFFGDEFELAQETRDIALPLAYGSLSIQDVIDRAEGDASLRLDGDGRVTALYSGEILRDNANKIFPPVPGLFEFEIRDSVDELPLPVNGSYRLDKGIFDNTNIFFKFRYNEKETIRLVMKIASVNKDGQVWKKEYLLNFADDADGEITTETSLLASWVAFPVANKIKFQYEAYRPNGERILLNYAAMRFDVLKFVYLDGYFGNHTFDIKGDIIKINIFDLWKSGGLEIENPTIRLDVDNSFGFPVRSKVNQLTLKTIGNNLFNVESEYINKGIDFSYPAINEVGSVKNTVFHFDGTNSNIEELFKEKVVQVIYDFDALANPDGDIGVKNFYTSDAFFAVKVDVELPMKIKSNQFTIADTFDVSFDDYSEAIAAELKIRTANPFPVDMDIQMIFLDAAGNELSRLTEQEIITINGAPLNGKDKTTEKITQDFVVNFDEIRFSKIKTTKKILFNASLDTNTQSQQPIWLFGDYGLDVKLAAIVKLK
ncbi:MAG: hypothetical protein IPN29_08545 [Saprospiraceae bacterium]|nr:hypothetical protein [Saprospiraceae bacterium]